MGTTVRGSVKQSKLQAKRAIMAKKEGHKPASFKKISKAIQREQGFSEERANRIVGSIKLKEQKKFGTKKVHGKGNRIATEPAI